MSRLAGVLCLMLLLVPLEAPPVRAQQVQRAAVGAALGVGGGAAITMATVVARARFQREYLESVNDLIHWQSVPMILTPAVGVAFGLAGEEALRASFEGSVTGLVAGAAVGATLGWIVGDTAEWPWAGGVMGGGIGLAAVGLVEGLRAWREDPDPDVEFPRFLRFGLSVPVR